MSQGKPVIAWFRQDLRLADNPALRAAAATNRPVLPLYILDDDSAGEWTMGGASRWWLHRSLMALDESLDGKLHIARGRADEIIPALAEEFAVAGIHWNRCYEPWRIRRDRRLREIMRRQGIDTRSYGGSLLFEPQSVTKQDGTPYRVFTPYYRKGCLQGSPEPRLPGKAPALDLYDTTSGLAIDELGLLPDIRWYEGMESAWTPGEAGACRNLDRFLEEGLKHYRDGRDRPDKPYVSRLSPHLHFGELSPNQAWYGVAHSIASERDIDHFQSELGWREFSHYLLYHWPEMTSENLQRKFDRFPWRDDRQSLLQWQQGNTGIPIVDAGMRQLWQTGYMHNRVRMIAASFLVKNLLIHWHHGASWFWDTLVDADLANNSASWQWVAGSGADAAPYFRIFNPVTQGRKFDPDGEYVRGFVPELVRLPTQYLHAPWEAPSDVLSSSGVALGDNYPVPMVDLRTSRERALDAFKTVKLPAA